MVKVLCFSQKSFLCLFCSNTTRKLYTTDYLHIPVYLTYKQMFPLRVCSAFRNMEQTLGANQKVISNEQVDNSQVGGEYED